MEVKDILFQIKVIIFHLQLLNVKTIILPSAENELFGPVLSVMKFNTEEEVINKMNDNQYGLSSGVYTKILVEV